MTLGFLISTSTIDSWLESYGYLVVFVLVMLESIGVPVPGETALIGARALRRLDAQARDLVGDRWPRSPARSSATTSASRSAATAAPGCCSATATGSACDEGRLKIGIWLFRRHGGKVVFWGRFVSILRTWAAFLAGTNRMPWPRFLVFNAAGGIVWATLFGVVYYFFGSVLEQAEHGDRRRRSASRGSRSSSRSSSGRGGRSTSCSSAPSARSTARSPRSSVGTTPPPKLWRCSCSRRRPRW